MLSGRLLPAHPHPESGELFTSWVSRIAPANVVKIHSLSVNIWGRESGDAFWSRDIDASVSKTALVNLCKRTGVKFQHASQTTLRSYEGVLFEQLHIRGLNRWILPAGIYHRTRSRHWIVFCPICLREDQEPYFRKSWRLSFNTVCEHHGVQMLDACPCCSEPVVFFRQELGHRNKYDIESLTSCYQCGFDLRHSPAFCPSAPDGQTLSMLMSLITFHDMGWWFVGREAEVLPYSLAYFDILHHLATWLTSQVGSHILQYTEKITGYTFVNSEVFVRQPFEVRTLLERHRLLMVALWLLQNWPERFIGICCEVGVTVSRITRSERLAYWFMKEVDLALAGQDVIARNPIR